MATPCSVKAYGATRRIPPQLEITICDFKQKRAQWEAFVAEVASGSPGGDTHASPVRSKHASFHETLRL
jgi:hypothetical protein